MVARPLCMRKALGSNPSISNIFALGLTASFIFKKRLTPRHVICKLFFLGQNAQGSVFITTAAARSSTSVNRPVLKSCLSLSNLVLFRARLNNDTKFWGFDLLILSIFRPLYLNSI